MEDVAEKAITRVITLMRENLGEPLTIDDMARVAMFSKFHFSRMFLRVTGVSPGRFLSAVRFEEAKRLLVETSLSVTDISHQVGYTSVGTFSSRFRSNVGTSPSTYRRLGGATVRPRVEVDRPPQPQHAVTIRGRVRPPLVGCPGITQVGLFPGHLPDRWPIRCASLDQPGPYELREVPPGTWYLLAHAVPPVQDELIPQPRSGDGSGQFVGCHGPITVGSDPTLEFADIFLRPMNALDPPVLLAVPNGRTVRRAG